MPGSPGGARVDFQRLRFEFTFWRDGRPICCQVEDRIVHYHGTIVALDEDFKHETSVGHFEFYEFKAPFDPDGDNEELFESMDEQTEHSIVLGEILEHAASMEEFQFGLTKVVYLARLEVEPAYRRQGIGQAFLWRVLEYFAGQGPVGVFLMATPVLDSGATSSENSQGPRPERPSPNTVLECLTTKSERSPMRGIS